MSITKFDLWTESEAAYRIADLINELDYVKSTLNEETPREIVRKIIELGGERAIEYNAISPQSNPERTTVALTINDYDGSIAIQGKGAVYDEFGTGEEGASDPHPMKEQFGLNPYNSGPYVSTHINKNGRHYWFAPRWSSDPWMYSNGYTEGVPSGKQMYKTLLYVRNIKDNIIKEEINKAIQTLK